MKALINKPVLMDSIPNKRNGKGVDVPNNVIKLRTITNAERQQLRIPSYKYLLP